MQKIMFFGEKITTPSPDPTWQTRWEKFTCVQRCLLPYFIVDVKQYEKVFKTVEEKYLDDLLLPRFWSVRLMDTLLSHVASGVTQMIP